MTHFKKLKLIDKLFSLQNSDHVQLLDKFSDIIFYFGNIYLYHIFYMM